MSIELVSEEKYSIHIDRPVWGRIKDFLKSCITSHSSKGLLHENGSLIDKDHFRESICTDEESSKKREITWPYLLNIYSPSMRNEEKKIYRNEEKLRYNRLKGLWQERISRGDSFYLRLADKILKDVRRTDRHLQFFQKKKEMLFNLMMTYSVYHPDPGYSQGMTDMLTPIVYVFVDESFSYLAFCSLMNDYMASLFNRDEIVINHRLYLFNTILESIDFDLWKKINSNEENYFCVYRWLLLDCKREFDQFDQVLRVLELVWIYSIPSNFSSFQSMRNDQSLFTVFLSISILQEDREKVFSCSNEEDLHKYFLSSSSSKSHRSTKTILERAQIYYSNYVSDQ